jgi:hypothetical protein
MPTRQFLLRDLLIAVTLVAVLAARYATSLEDTLRRGK